MFKSIVIVRAKPAYFTLPIHCFKFVTKNIPYIFDVNRFEVWVGFATQPDPLKLIHFMSMQFNRIKTYIHVVWFRKLIAYNIHHT